MALAVAVTHLLSVLSWNLAPTALPAAAVAPRLPYRLATVPIAMQMEDDVEPMTPKGCRETEQALKQV